jgi:hypothetical protein
MNVKLQHLKEVIRLNDLTKHELRRINRTNDRAYTGKELTKLQLIYQIVFQADAPNLNE